MQKVSILPVRCYGELQEVRWFFFLTYAVLSKGDSYIRDMCEKLIKRRRKNVLTFEITIAFLGLTLLVDKTS